MQKNVIQLQWARDRNLLQNELYGVIFPIMSRHESLGQNAHHFAQRMIQTVMNEADGWVQNTPPEPPAPQGPEPT